MLAFSKINILSRNLGLRSPFFHSIKNMSIDLYYMAGSPPCRAVRIAATSLGLKFNLKPVDIIAAEHKKPEFIKINPQSTLPTIVDNDLKLWESRAIMIYLVEKYAKGSALYPNEPEKRAIINQRLMFDQGTLYDSILQYWMDMMSKKPITEEHMNKVEKSLELLNTFLEGSKYVTGDVLTLADITLYITVWCMDASEFGDFRKYSNVAKWYDMLKETLPERELNDEEFVLIKGWVGSMKKMK